MKSPQDRSSDPATIEMLGHVACENIVVAWDRKDAMDPQCGFGQLGICCRNCTMGPCRIDPFGGGATEGICGATADVIAARNLTRMIAGGGAAHSDHGRDIAHTLLMAAENAGCDYKPKDETKLRALAGELGVATEGKDLRKIGQPHPPGHPGKPRRRLGRQHDRHRPVGRALPHARVGHQPGQPRRSGTRGR